MLGLILGEFLIQQKTISFSLCSPIISMSLLRRSLSGICRPSAQYTEKKSIIYCITGLISRNSRACQRGCMFHGFKLGFKIPHCSTELQRTRWLAKDVYQAQAPRAPTPYDPPTLEKNVKMKRRQIFPTNFA